MNKTNKSNDSCSPYRYSDSHFYIKTIPTLPFGSLKENETKIQKSENDRLSFSWNYSVYCEVGYSLNMS